MTADVAHWEAWENGLNAAKQALAEAETEHADTPVSRTWAAVSILAAPRHNPDRPTSQFCPVDGCGLTITAGAGRCWVHRPADKEGLL